MKSLDRATTIRRTVANKAYQLLENCREPEPVLDGYDSYMKEHWTIEFDDLWYEVVNELQNKWEFEEGDELDRQIKTHVENFFENGDYEEAKEEIARRYYEYQQEQYETQKYQRAHQPKWRP